MAPDLNSVPLSPRTQFATPPSGLSQSPPTQYARPSGKKPNILYIMADQLAAPLLKMHNPSSVIKTPNLDALAKDAVLFDSAYCPSPLCAPSRMSMVSGQLPTKIGSYDNASSIDPSIPTYAHYLRAAGYETTLAGKMHFIGEQLHGYESRLTSDIYPGDYGWSVNWEEPDRRLEWYHNASSILQAGPCVRSNQLDYDEEVMYKSKQFLYDHVRKGANTRPFCMTVSLTHPHDPYTIEKKYWDMYEDVDIPLPDVNIPQEELDSHSQRLLRVCDLWGKKFTHDEIKRARRAYFGAVSYVDDCIGKLIQTLKDCRLDQDTIIVFSGDHGDMLGERGLWYKMSYFEASVRVPLLVHHPATFKPHRVSSNVSTLDILPTLVDIVKSKLWDGLPMDGNSLLPHLEERSGGSDTVFAEYCGEGTIAPMMMIRRGDWKYITCPADPDQLYNLATDPKEIVNLASLPSKHPLITAEVSQILSDFVAEAKAKWDMEKITSDVLISQKQRRLVWSALKQGAFTSWDHNPNDDGREKYIRSHMHLDDLELRARYPAVDAKGREMYAGLGGMGAGGMGGVITGQAGAYGQ
ncbi:Alkaline phosphatase-like protein [Glarea lozoyensis ATCC 20868]|uniref:Alkaline phosphatase-like protein n=1 Tax=Glarea lozoyensis (strain ATCC 20868 / MF5171) TaxID=1116229 RepID=S3DN79_GLAL2|nr:Alkaline phosphatase-like protein [Glarea lozoyensis ATCC 20868]EPE33551.1 Alkaline phosphatase-like protein [Glarea lozoyensis ATCC 20868]